MLLSPHWHSLCYVLHNAHMPTRAMGHICLTGNSQTPFHVSNLCFGRPWISRFQTQCSARCACSAHCMFGKVGGNSIKLDFHSAPVLLSSQSSLSTLQAGQATGKAQDKALCFPHAHGECSTGGSGQQKGKQFHIVHCVGTASEMQNLVKQTSPQTA